MCASEILPGPAIIITIDDARRIKSSSTPISPVKHLSSFDMENST